MSLNFFQDCCRTDINTQRFGICDGDFGARAFVTISRDEEWVAEVLNGGGIIISFFAIDNCIVIKKENGDDAKRCDAMLKYEGNIVFIELKEQAARWINQGIEQLSETISIFRKSHDINDFAKRRAFLANRKHPSFQYGHKETMERFKVEHGVRLILHNKIKI